MSRLQGLPDDQTNPVSDALGGAGGAVRGYLNTKRQISEDAAREEQRARDAEAFKLTVGRIKQEMGARQQEIQAFQEDRDLERQQRADMQESNAMGAEAVAATAPLDKLGPRIRGFVDRVVQRASTMDPRAGERAVAIAGAAVAQAANEHARDTYRGQIHDSTSSGFWLRAAEALKQVSGGVDLDGDGAPDMAPADIAKMGEGFAALIDDDTLDPAQVYQQFQFAVRRINAEVSRWTRRQDIYNQGIAAVAESRQGTFGRPGTMSSDAQSEAEHMLELFRIGAMGDGPQAERDISNSIEALRRNQMYVRMPDGYPIPFVQVPLGSGKKLGNEGLYRMFGAIPSTSEEYRQQRVDSAFKSASAALEKLASTNHLDTDEYMTRLVQLAQRIDSLSYPGADPLDWESIAGATAPSNPTAPPKPKSGAKIKASQYPGGFSKMVPSVADTVRSYMKQNAGMKIGQAIKSAVEVTGVDFDSLSNADLADIYDALGIEAK